MEKPSPTQPDTGHPASLLERDKWEAEKSFRAREIAVKEREQATKESALDLQKKDQAASQWRSPLIVAILAAAVAAAGNAVVAFTNGTFQRQLEAQKSEQARILEMIKTGDPDKAAENIQFLLDAWLIAEPDTRTKLSDYLSKRTKGSGPSLPASTETKSFINTLEYGDPKGLDAWIEKGAKLADEFGVKTKLGRAMIAAEVISAGPGRVRRVAEATTTVTGGTPAAGVDEKTWIAEYINQMPKVGGVPKQFLQRRIDLFKSLIDANDWELLTYKGPAPE